MTKHLSDEKFTRFVVRRKIDSSEVGRREKQKQWRIRSFYQVTHIPLLTWISFKNINGTFIDFRSAKRRTKWKLLGEVWEARGALICWEFHSPLFQGFGKCSYSSHCRKHTCDTTHECNPLKISLKMSELWRRADRKSVICGRVINIRIAMVNGNSLVGKCSKGVSLDGKWLIRLF